MKTKTLLNAYGKAAYVCGVLEDKLNILGQLDDSPEKQEIVSTFVKRLSRRDKQVWLFYNRILDRVGGNHE